MWFVHVNGGWHSAADDAALFEWARQGYVGPHTFVRHESWPAPVQAREVPVLGHFFASMQGPPPPAPVVPSPKSGGTGKITRIALWFFALAFVSAFIVVRSTMVVPLAAILLPLVVVGVLVANKFAPGCPDWARRLARALLRRPVLLTVWMATLFMAGGVGASNIWSRASDCREKMAGARSDEGTYDQAMKRIDEARTACAVIQDEARVVALNAIERQIRQKECTAGSAQLKASPRIEMPADQALQALQGRKAALESGARLCEVAEARPEAQALRARLPDIDAQISAAQQAVNRVASEKKEREALAHFPARSSDAKAKLMGATAKVNVGQWGNAGLLLDDAKSILAEFDGTSVQATPSFLALAKQSDTLRARVGPQLERIRKQEELAAAKAAATEVIRGEKPMMSAWDGSCSPCEGYLKHSLNDPDSYDHVRSSDPEMEGESWTVTMVFRAKNAFGAKVLGARKFYIQRGQVVKTVAISD